MTSPLDLGELEPWEVGAERICEAMLARAPIAIRRAAENLYEALLFDVQDYLRENVHYNLSAELAMAKRVARAAFRGGLSPDMVSDMKWAAEHIGKLADDLAREKS